MIPLDAAVQCGAMVLFPVCLSCRLPLFGHRFVCVHIWLFPSVSEANTRTISQLDFEQRHSAEREIILG